MNTRVLTFLWSAEPKPVVCADRLLVQVSSRMWWWSHIAHELPTHWILLTQVIRTFRHQLTPYLLSSISSRFCSRTWPPPYHLYSTGLITTMNAFVWSFLCLFEPFKMGIHYLHRAGRQQGKDVLVCQFQEGKDFLVCQLVTG